MNDFLKINQGIFVTCCIIFPILVVGLSLLYHFKKPREVADPTEPPDAPKQP